MRTGETIEVRCKFGKLVAEVFTDGGDHCEIAIDLVRPDGSATQVVVCGTNERRFDERDELIHTYIWDGDGECAAEEFYTKPNGGYSYRDAEGVG